MHERMRLLPVSEKKEEKGCFHFAANDSIEGFDFRQVGIGAGRGGRIRSGEPIDFRA